MAGDKPQFTMQVASPLPSGVAVEENFSVQHHFLKPVERTPRLHSNYSIIIHLSRSACVEWSNKGLIHQAHLLPGSVSLHPVGELPGFRLETEAELLEITLSPIFVQHVLQEDISGLRELKSVYGISDPQVQHLGMSLRRDKEAGYPAGKLFGDCLMTALTAYLFTQYRADPAFPPSGGRLSHRDRNSIREYVHAHLAEDVTLTALAALTTYSPHHFSLLFKQTFTLSPHQYVIRARVEEARHLLAASSVPLAEIAYRVGFSSQSHFSLCFKRLIGATPRQYRETLHKKPLSS